MNSKKVATFFFSTVGVIAALAIVVIANYALSKVRARVDLTADKVYTVSDGSKKILQGLDTPVTIRFYYSASEPTVPVSLKTYARRVEDLLREYEQIAPKFVRIETLDPKPDTDAEDSASLDGIEGQMLQNGERLFLGVSFTSLDQKEAIAFMRPDRERLLEYDLSRAISRVTATEKPTIGVLSALPVMGSQPTPQMMRMGQFQGAPAWMAITELKSDFDVEQIEVTATEIPEDIDVLLAIHPKGISEATEYAIDQFVLRGGKLIAMVDPLSVFDPAANQGNPMMGGNRQETSSTLNRLFESWGVKFEKGKVVADQARLTRVGGRNGQPEENYGILSLNTESVNTNDIATSQIGNVLMPFAGAFSGDPSDGLTKTVLLRSSDASQMVESFMAQMGGQAIKQDFKPDGSEKDLAVRLSGKFKTAFPDGKPGSADEPNPAEGDEKKEEEKDDSNHIAQAAEENHVVLIADADMLYDQVCVQVQNLMGMRIVRPLNANINLLQNLVEQMAGDSNLINARSRAIRNRPFTKIAKMRTESEAKYREKIKEMEKGLQETQRKLNELQRAKDDKSQRLILSAEQKAELAKFRQQQVDTNKKLKELRKDLRRDIDSLQNTLKWANILGMPAVVIILGLLVGLIKRQRTAAK